VRNFLESSINQELDLHCGAITISGTVKKIEGDVLVLEKDGVTCYVNIDKIIVAWKSREKKGNFPGFITGRAS
jgi:hypothetical protein